MKFWLTLIISIIASSALLTYIYVNQAKAPPRPTRPQTTTLAAQEPPKIVFEGVKQDVNVIPLDAGDTPLNGSNSVEVVFRNVGKGPLTLRLIGTNCGCVHDLTIDGKKLEPKGEGVTRMPGEGGTIKMTWTPKPDMQAGTQLRFTADLLSNDPQYADTIRLEVITRLVPPKEGTK